MNFAIKTAPRPALGKNPETQFFFAAATSEDGRNWKFRVHRWRDYTNPNAFRMWIEADYSGRDATLVAKHLSEFLGDFITNQEEKETS